MLSLALDTKKAAINQLLSVRLTIIQNVCARVRLDRNEVVAAVSIIMFCCFFMQYYYIHSLCFQNEFCLFFLYMSEFDYSQTCLKMAPLYSKSLSIKGSLIFPINE